MPARSTKLEMAERRRLEAIISKDDAQFGSPEKAQFHKSRARLRIEELEEQARKRFEQRSQQSTTREKKRATIKPGEWSPERIAAFQAKMVAGRKPSGTVFLLKVAKAPDEAKNSSPREVPAEPKPSPVSTTPARVTVTDRNELYCEIHSYDLEQCGCASPQPTAEALRELREADEKDGSESRLPGTPCPICLCDRSYCQHSGRVSSAVEFARSIFTASR